MEETEQERLERLANLLFQAARNGDAATLQEAVQGGAPVDLANQNGDTLLMLAAYHGRVDAARVLLEAGASVDQVNDRGQTPLAGVVFKGFTDVAALLLDHGADPQAGTPPAVSMAVLFGRDDVLQLIEAGHAAVDPEADRPPPTGR